MHRAYIDSLTFEGYLEKQGKLKTWSWKKYWFCLEDDQLCYFKDSTKTSGQGLIDLAQAQTVRVIPVSRGPSLEILTQARTHVLCAADAGLRDKWLKFLRQAMVLRKRRSSLMMRPSCDSISDEEEHLYETITRQSMTPSFDRSQSLDEQLAANSEIMHTNSLYVRSSDVRRSSEPEPQLYAEVNKVNHQAAVEMRSKKTSGKSGGQQKCLARLEYESHYAEPFDSCTKKVVKSGDQDELYDEVFCPDINGTVRPPGEDVEEVEEEEEELGKKEYKEQTMEVNNNDANPRFTFNFPPAPSLPNPRLELTWGSVFDEIRTFIANNRRPNELYAIPRKCERDGNAVEKLKEFLAQLDN